MKPEVLFVVGAALCLIGCSTYAIVDVYASELTGTEHISFGDKEARVSMRFSPDPKFGSVGLLGMPAIPVLTRSAPTSSLILEVELKLSREAMFSFESAPCLATPDTRLCPQRVRISPLFDSADEKAKDENGKRTYGRIRIFTEREMELVLTSASEGERISSEQIFDHYGYTGKPPWTFGIVRLWYEYACERQCPSDFVLSTDNLVAAGVSVRTEGRFHFKLKRVKVYEALTPAQ